MSSILPRLKRASIPAALIWRQEGTTRPLIGRIYAAFQAAVALLVAFDIRPKRNSWEHKFVHAQLSGKLIVRRKAFPAKFRTTLVRLLDTRVVADYRPQPVKRSDAQKAVREASE